MPVALILIVLERQGCESLGIGRIRNSSLERGRELVLSEHNPTHERKMKVKKGDPRNETKQELANTIANAGS